MSKRTFCNRGAKAKAIELIDIDFSKYDRIMIERVIIECKITANNDGHGGVVIVGSVNNDCILRSFYEEEEIIRIREVDKKCLSISRRSSDEFK